MSVEVVLKDRTGADQTYTVDSAISLPLSGGGTQLFYLPVSSSALIGVLDGTITELSAQDLAGLTTLRESGLYALQDLISVEFPSGLEVIDYNAVADCPSLTTVVFPNTPLVIGTMAFNNDGAISAVTWGSGITSMGNAAFYYCTSLEAVDLPSVQSVEAQAFAGCSSLETIDLGSSCTLIGSGAFMDCTSLVSLTVRSTTPPSLVSDALSGCTNLTAIYVPAQSVSAYQSASGWSTYTSIIEAIQS